MKKFVKAITLKKIIDGVLYRRNKWNNHINRMAEDSLATTVRYNRPTGKILPGKPKKRWRYSLDQTEYTSIQRIRRPLEHKKLKRC